MRHNKKEYLTVLELKEKITQAIETEYLKLNIIESDYTLSSTKKRDKKRSPKNNINRYEWALKILNKLPNEILSNAKNTANESVNVGDIGETYLKYLKAKKDNETLKMISTSKQGENDLNRERKAECKTVSRYSPANEWNGSVGIIAIIQSSPQFRGGIYWVNRECLKQGFKKGQRVDHKTLREIIINNNIQMGVSLGL